MFWKKRESLPVMTPEELCAAVEEGNPPVIVDVRSARQFSEGHLPGAINIPLSELDGKASGFDPATSTVFY
ncbi:MAG TPA: rhodanese-like domain-containing protein [Blastocatellia bacterium]|nr:rhodanese-like domain-containing protein [Blastocatellia bacterium]